ncbi:hypothetical protein [Ralstonia pickettii]|uniref:hypothetical protein n=1 Tax=Ralstonia pickettii TaxID=329 RepID=UPI000818C742|nr:hypothetical protein [Ralstonia pickettii]OCS44021.1 hypothetical protein BEK68_18305 [Ralstonia pickettii]
MLKKIAPALIVATLAGLTALPAAADDLRNAMGGHTGGIVGAGLGGGAGAALGGNVQRNSYSDRDDRGYRRHGKHHHHH